MVQCLNSGTCEGSFANDCASQFGGNFKDGGYAGALYGYLFCWIGTICVFIPMAELASMWVMLLAFWLMMLTSVEGTYLWWAISLGFHAGSKILPEVSQLYRRFVFES